MANWCYNEVTFENNQNVLALLKQLFESLAEKEIKQEQGQLPDFIQNGNHYMFSINWTDDTVSYQTKWSPNIEEMKQVADYFGTGFIYYYEELGSLVYGEARYEKGILKTVIRNVKKISQSILLGKRVLCNLSCRPALFRTLNMGRQLAYLFRMKKNNFWPGNYFGAERWHMIFTITPFGSFTKNLRTPHSSFRIG